MRQSLIFLMAFLLMTTQEVFSQQFPVLNNSKCGFDDVKIMLDNESKLPIAGKYKEIEQKLNDYLLKNRIQQNNQRYFPNGPEFIIPIVVHIVHNGEPIGTGTNISYAQVKSQLDAINAGFSNYSAAANYYQNLAAAQYAALPKGINAVDTKIRFCLATEPGQGVSWTNAAEPGVMRYSDATASRHEFSVVGQTAISNLTQSAGSFPSSSFLNIWVVTAIRFGDPVGSGDCPGIQGYASIAGYTGPEARVIDGVVLRSDIVGDNSVNSNNFPLQPIANPSCPGGTSSNFANRGKIAIHEIGHFLGLYHTFQNCAGSSTALCNSTGDFICDTDPCDQPAVSVSCGASNMPENFMYYADDDILNTFTAGQCARMYAMLNTVRDSLVTELNVLQTGVLGSNGCFAATVMAEFTQPDNFCVNIPASFVNVNNTAGSNLANQWQWTVTPSSGVTVASPTSAATQITFTATGNYTVKLTVSNSGTQVTSFQQIINVIACEIEACRNNQLHWIFGWGYCGVDFSSGTPVPTPLPSAIMTTDGNQESYITESDPQTGELLFYSNGVNVYNAAHTRINTTILHPLGGLENTNGQILSVPFPGHPKQYLLIIPNRGWYNPPILSVAPNYPPISVYLVDMNGAGTVSAFNCPLSVAANAGETIDFNLFAYNEQITAVPHENGRDYWIIFPAKATNNKLYYVPFLLNAGGLTQKPLGLASSSGGVMPYGCGIVANKEHNRVALKYTNGTDGNVYLSTASFNNRTGTFGIPANFNVAQYGIEYAGGIIFSDVNHIYMSRLNFGSLSGIAEMDLITGTVTNFSDNLKYYRFGTGPDGNVYVLSQLVFGGSGSIGLCRIDRFGGIPTVTTVIPGNLLSPNLVNPIGQNFWNLPNNVHCPPPERQPDFTMVRTDCNTFQFQTTDNGYWQDFDATWDFGDGSPLVTLPAGQTTSHTYLTAGDYTVILNLQTTISGCAGSMVITIPTVSHLLSVVNPGTAVTINGPVSICLGSNVHEIEYNTFYSSTANYLWSISGGGNILAPATGNGISSIKILFGNTAGTRTINLTINDGGCNLSGTLNVILNEPGPSFAGNDGSVSICSNQSIPVDLFSIITGEQSGGTWSRISGVAGVFNAASGTFNPAPGASNSIFRYIIAATANCNSADSSDAVVNITTSNNAGTDGIITVCDNDNSQIDLFSIVSGELTGGTWERVSGSGGIFNAATATFTVSTGTSNSVFNYVLPGTNGCGNDTSKALIQINAAANAGLDVVTTICDENSAAINLFGLLSGAQPAGTWTRLSGTGGNFDMVAGTFSPPFTIGNSVFLYVIFGTAPCENDSSVVNIQVGSTSQLVDKSILACNNERVNLTGLYNLAGLTIIENWTINGIPVTDPTSISTTGIYRLIVGNGSFCTDTLTVDVSIRPRVNAFAGTDMIAVQGVSLPLSGTGGGSYSWSWYPVNAIVSNPFISNPTVVLINPVYEFYLQVKDNAGCTGNDTVKIKVYKGPTYYLPAAFTPNADGMNDQFIPIEVGIVSTQWFRVFNRYGQLIFNTNSQHKGWDGTFKGIPQDNGTYTWLIKGTGYNGKTIEKKGTVVLIR